ncbi:MAG: ABC-F family ATP-binding cassette domain-containing protein [Alphaproteobacteria bacterium]|nr:ABC-F family ATP-binding cassette domain-containing protein [Alphaproteobacteria bacterium]
MSVLVAEELELSWGDRHVLQGLSLSVGERERVGLVGPNGCGKSSFLSIAAGKLGADAGQVRLSGRLALLEQDPAFPGETVDDVVKAAVAWHGALHAEWEAAVNAGDLERSAALQARLDEAGWSVEHRIDGILDQLGAPPRDRALAGLSGGERRRLALAATLLEQPDVLLLDEPTNHLDARTITWLERFLVGYRGAVVIVTHDRYLLEAVAERIIEIESGQAVSYDGSYADYLIARAERHAHLQRTEDRRLRILARESEWASRSPAARTTKQKARLKRLDDLRANATALPKERSFELDFSTGLKSSGTFLEAHDVNVSIAGRALIRDLSLAVRPGDRIGIVGDNGMGKSTLLRVLTGELEAGGVVAMSGVVHKAPRVKLGMLDQARTGLNETDTVFEAAGGGNDQIQVGDTWVHVATFLGRLLFTREQFDARVEGLSGGERARLLLAKKMLEGNAVLLLDEPTNDLDLWTLRVLEEALLDFDGAAVVVTHDRAFLDRVCTAVLAFEGDGRVVRYADRLQAERAATKTSPAPPPPKATPAPPPPPADRPKRLSFKEKQELDALPDRIDALETEMAALEATLADPGTYRDRADAVPALSARLEALPAEIDALFTRWESLSERA